jgi:hypothetical protein
MAMDAKTPKLDPETSSRVIDLLGGTSATAELCEVQPPSVSDWRHNGIPKSQEKYLRLLRPDVFQQIDDQAGPPPTGEVLPDVATVNH